MSEAPYVIVADPAGPNYCFARAVYENVQKRSDDFRLVHVTVTRFRDGELKTKIESNIRKKECFFIHDSNKDPASWFLELCLVNSTLRNSSAAQVVDVLPYLKFSRQDRKDESRVPISAAVIANTIKGYAHRVMALDIHNPSLQGFYEPVPFDHLQSFPTVVSYLQRRRPEVLDDVVVMSTDVGGGERTKLFAKKAGIEAVALSYKTRPKAGEIGSIRILGDVKEKNVLIIDDLLDSGNTIAAACTAARTEGAKNVYAYCTHALLTQGTEALTRCLDRLFVGDTVYHAAHPSIETISFVPLFSEAIYRTTRGESLSELFNI